jgi:hypothetical protein
MQAQMSVSNVYNFYLISQHYACGIMFLWRTLVFASGKGRIRKTDAAKTGPGRNFYSRPKQPFAGCLIDSRSMRDFVPARAADLESYWSAMAPVRRTNGQARAMTYIALTIIRPFSDG